MPRWNVHFDMHVRTGDPELVGLVAKARALASVIHGIPIPPHLQERLDRLNIVRAVRGTTGIEGVELSEEEVGEVLDAPAGTRVLAGSREREEQEVKNAAALMHAVAETLENAQGAPLSEALVQAIHSIVTHNIDYLYNVPGRYRTHRVVAGSYVPPEDGEEVARLMAEFMRWFATGAPAAWDPIVRAVAAHFYVISIHPFGDGNGRTSRAVESYLLYLAGINARGFYSLANFYYRNRPQYFEELDRVRFQTDPDLTPFVLFALRGLVEELEEVHAEVLREVRLISFRDYAREALSGENKLGTPVGKRQFMFLLGLGREPISLGALRAGGHPLSALYRGVTTKTLTRDINALKKLGLVVVAGDTLKANLEFMRRFTARRPPTGIRLGESSP